MLLFRYYIIFIIIIAAQLLNETSSIIIMLSTSSSSTTNVMSKHHRVELFFKNQSELIERVRFLRDGYGVSRFNLVNKNKDEPLASWVQTIRKEIPESDISVHYSLKYNKAASAGRGVGGRQRKKQRQNQGVGAHAARLTTFCNQVGLLSNYGTTTTNTNANANEILIVNGSGEKCKQWNTVTALSHVAAAAAAAAATTVAINSHSKKKNGGCCGIIAVAYNPYFIDSNLQNMENEMLKEKLGTNIVTKVYLQFGTDLTKLRRGLEYIHQLTTTTTNNNNNDNNKSTTETKKKEVTIAGSIFLPTAKLIAQQKFRPWNGVYLSEQFLTGPSIATEIVTNIIRLYDEFNVEILWEAPGIRNEKDMIVVQNLMKCVTTAAEAEESDNSLLDRGQYVSVDEADFGQGRVNEQVVSNKRVKIGTD